MVDFVEKRMAHSKRITLLIGVLLFTLTAALLFAIIKSLIPGKQIMTESELLSSYKSNGRVTVVSTKQNINVVYDDVLKSGELRGVYSMVSFDGKFLLVYAPEKLYASNLNNQVWRFDGCIYKYDNVDKLAAINAKKLDSVNGEDIAGNLLPYVLDCSVTGTENIPEYIIFGLFSLAGGLFLIRRFKRLLNPETNVTVISFSKYGSFDVVKSDINDEIANDTVFKLTNLIITKSWCVFTNFSDIKAVKLEDIIWAYKERLRGTTYSNYFVINCSDGSTHKLSILRQKKISAILLHLKTKFPWILVGYSKDHLSLWKSKQLIQIVNKQRQDYLSRR